MMRPWALDDGSLANDVVPFCLSINTESIEFGAMANMAAEMRSDITMEDSDLR